MESFTRNEMTSESQELLLDCKGITDDRLRELRFNDNLTVISLNSNLIQSLIELRFNDNLTVISLNNNLIQSLDNIRFPDKLKELWLFRNKISSLDNVIFPDELILLSLGGNLIENIQQVRFPPKLEDLTLSYNEITSFAGVHFPDELRILEIECNPTQYLENILFPNKLRRICLPTHIRLIINVRFPSSLHDFSLNSKIERIDRCWVSPSTHINASLNVINDMRESTREMAAIRIQQWCRNYLIRRHRAAFVIQKWYVARSYYMRSVVYQNSEKQYSDMPSVAPMDIDN